MKRLNYLQRTLALRCIRLIDQRHRYEDALSDWALHMIDNCVHASYMDCVDADCADHVAPFMFTYYQRQQAKR